MTCYFLAHRFAPAKPNPTVVLVSNKPKREPPGGADERNQTRDYDDENLPPLKLPTTNKRRNQQPWRVKANRLAQVNAQTQQRRAGKHQPRAILLQASIVDD